MANNNELGLMTSGIIWRQILRFSIPLILGNFIQQLYSTVDSIFVGNYVGKHALAAVGTSTPLINMLIGLFVGISTGASVEIARYYGAKKNELVSRAVHTAIAIAFISGVILTVCGVIFTPFILELVGTSSAIKENATIYLRLYFLGSLFFITYNMASGILRAVGDSINPLIILFVASVCNIFFDCIFVVWFKLGVLGVGIGTVISQFVSAVLVLACLINCKANYKVVLKKIRVDKHILWKMIWIGIPAGLQSTIISLSNVIVQGYFNQFTTDVVSGYSAYIRIDGFLNPPILSFGMAATTFTSQNIGANNLKRVREGAVCTGIISIIYTVTASLLAIILQRPLIMMFSKDEQVIKYGAMMLRYLVPFFFIMSIIQLIIGVIRGFGKAIPPMVIMVFNLFVVRIIWLKIMIPIMKDVKCIYMCYPISWVTAVICFIIYSLALIKKSAIMKKDKLENAI